MVSLKEAEAKGLWSEDPNQRLRVARGLTKAEATNLQKEIAAGSPFDPWPYGMPTVCNPVVVVLGPSPGDSPLVGDIEVITRNPYSHPTVGDPHPKMEYLDTAGFFKKIHDLFIRFMAHQHGLNRHDALSLAGLMNLDVGRHGNSAGLAFDPQLAGWALKTIDERLKPQILVCLGLSTRMSEILAPLSQSLDANRPTRSFPFRAYKKKTYRFREWILRRPNERVMRIVSWPQHPSRAPFSDFKLWQQSVDEYARAVLKSPDRIP